MRRIYQGFAFLSALSLVSHLNAAEEMKIDSSKSKIEFVGKKDDGQHKGGFKSVSGTSLVDMENHEKGNIKIVIDAKTLWADDEKLTDHLKNADFFNVREFPTITFESTKIEPNGDGKGTIIGKLTMLGKTVETKVPVTAEFKDTGLELHAKFNIDRTQWGMTYGAGKIKNEVELDAHLVMSK